MSELFDKSIRTLELPRVLQLLSEQAVSPEAKELALAVRPETDYEDVLRLLDQTDGARAMIVLRGAPGFSGVKPVKDLLDRADRGGSLNIPELIRIGDLGGIVFRGPAGRHRGRLDELLGAFGL